MKKVLLGTAMFASLSAFAVSGAVAQNYDFNLDHSTAPTFGCTFNTPVNATLTWDGSARQYAGGPTDVGTINVVPTIAGSITVSAAPISASTSTLPGSYTTNLVTTATPTGTVALSIAENAGSETTSATSVITNSVAGGTITDTSIGLSTANVVAVTDAGFAPDDPSSLTMAVTVSCAQ